ncbi:class I SAM-dependent methyltransferase [Chryseobacterium sp. KACC 21268]|nr:class I SAM-dependent methyltransferase [Chryseobacterium sp. KACC 21268]
MKQTNPWNTIPLDDYEQHMRHQEVAQAQLISALTNKYLTKYEPENILFLGISGGNGLEHIDANKAKRICGIDINQSYLEETKKRFGEKLEQLELFNLDISESIQSIIKADLLWAALIFEYVDLDNALRFVDNNMTESAKLIITIQSNNGAGSVSPTGIESIKSVKDIFKIVNKDELQEVASKFGLELTASEENGLPNGKSFTTFVFQKAEFLT